MDAEFEYLRLFDTERSIRIFFRASTMALVLSSGMDSIEICIQYNWHELADSCTHRFAESVRVVQRGSDTCRFHSFSIGPHFSLFALCAFSTIRHVDCICYQINCRQLRKGRDNYIDTATVFVRVRTADCPMHIDAPIVRALRCSGQRL